MTAPGWTSAGDLCTMVKNQVEYDETIWATRDAEREKRFEAKLKRQAKQRGYELVPIEQKPAA